MRELAPGQHFTLMRPGLSDGGDSCFTVLAVTHEAANNLEGNAKAIHGLAGASSTEQGAYRSEAICVNAELPMVPQPIRKPLVPGFQSAIVVGAENDSLPGRMWPQR